MLVMLLAALVQAADAPADIDEAIRLLQGTDLRERAKGLRYLGTRAKDGDVPKIIELIDSPRVDVRMFALSALESLDLRGHTAPLIRRMAADDVLVRHGVLLLLGRTGQPAALEEVRKWLDSKEYPLRNAARYALIALDPAAAARELRPLLKSEDAGEAGVALNAVSVLRDPEVLKELEGLVFEGRHASVASQALYRLAAAAPENLAAIVVRALSHKSEPVRNAAAVVADRAPGAEVAAALAKALDDPSESVRANAAMSLATLGAKGHEVRIRTLLDSTTPYVRAMAASALGRLDDQTSLARLERMLKDTSDPLVQSHIIRALHDLKPPRFVDVVSPCLKSADEVVRIDAAKFLAERGEWAAEPVLAEVLKGKNWRSALMPLLQLHRPESARKLGRAVAAVPARGTVTVDDALAAVRDGLKAEAFGLDAAIVDAPSRLRPVAWQGSSQKVLTVIGWLAASGRRPCWFLKGESVVLMHEAAARDAWSAWLEKSRDARKRQK